MAKGYVSPGVSYAESAVASDTTPINKTSVGIIGFALKGGFEPKEVKTVSELHKIYGTSFIGEVSGKKVYSKAIIAAERILKYTNSVIFCRLPIADAQMEKFTVSSEECEFELATYDAGVKSIKLVQFSDHTGDEPEYTYTVYEIDKSGAERVICKDIDLADLNDFVNEEGTLKNFSIYGESFPLEEPADATEQTIAVEYGEAVVDKKTSFTFETYIPTERLVESAEFEWSDTDKTYVAETESMKFKVVQPEEITESVAEFVNTPGTNEWVADNGAIKVSTTVESIDGEEVEIDSDGVAEFSGVTFRFEKFRLSNTSIFSGNWMEGWSNVYWDACVNPHIINFASYIEITQAKIDSGATETFDIIDFDFSKITKTGMALPVRLGLRLTGDLTYPFAWYYLDNDKGCWSHLETSLSPSGIVNAINSDFGAGFATLTDPSATSINAVNNALIKGIKIECELDDSDDSDGIAKWTGLYTVSTIKYNDDLFETQAHLAEDEIIDWLNERWYFNNVSKGSGFPVNASLVTDIDMACLWDDSEFGGTYWLGVHKVGDDPEDYQSMSPYDESEEPSKSEFLEYYTNFIRYTEFMGDARGYRVVSISRNPGVSDSDFPLPSGEMEFKSVKYQKVGDKYQISIKMIDGTDTPYPSLIEKNQIVSALNTDPFTATALIPETSDDFPIIQPDLNVYDTVTVQKNNKGKYSVLADATAIVNGTATVDNIIASVNATSVLTATRKASDDRDFPIVQPRTFNVTAVTTSANTDGTYNVNITVNGVNYLLMENVEKSDFLATLATSTIEVPYTGTVVPLLDIKQLLTGRCFPIYQEDIITERVYDIDADAVLDLTSLTDSQIKVVFDYFNSVEDINISVLIAPYGDVLETLINSSSDSVTTKKRKIKETYRLLNNSLVDVAETRTDCMTVLDYPETFNYADVVTFFKTEDYDCSNACSCYPGVEYSDIYEGAKTNLPASAILGTQMAYTDSVSACWFAPAGLESGRGVVKDATKVLESLTAEQRDTLYRMNINPIKDFVGTGAVLWGDETLKKDDSYGVPSVMGKIGTRRLANYIKKLVLEKSMDILFTPNDEQSWDSWKNSIRPALREIQNNRGIEDFKIVMDRTTITEEDIANGKAPGVIYVKPTTAIEYVQVNFVMTQSGISFE